MRVETKLGIKPKIQKKSQEPILELSDQFVLAGKKSLEQYHKTGLHTTMEELSGWLKSWGSKKNVKAPKCHK